MAHSGFNEWIMGKSPSDVRYAMSFAILWRLAPKGFLSRKTKPKNVGYPKMIKVVGRNSKGKQKKIEHAREPE
jgi:hypothetical protein